MNHPADAEDIPSADPGEPASDFESASTLHVSAVEVSMGDMSKTESASKLDDSKQGSVHASKLAKLKELPIEDPNSGCGARKIFFSAVGVVVTAVIVVVAFMLARRFFSSSSQTEWQQEPWAYETMLSALSVELYNETHTSAVMGLLSPTFAPYNAAVNDYSLEVVRGNPTYPTRNMKLSFKVGNRGPGGTATGA